LKEHVWDFDLEEEIDLFFQAAGIDSEYFFNTFGLPLYIYAITIILAILLPFINLCVRTGCSYEADEPDSSGEKAPADFEGGEQDSPIDPK
jgi:hypothetical protein